VKIDEDAIAVRGRRFERRDDVRANPANGRFLNIDREKAPCLGGLLCAPLVGPLAANFQGFRRGIRAFERLEPLPSFGADGRRHGNDARDVRGAVRIKGCGVGRRGTGG
jgi:hypothetical protein